MARIATGLVMKNNIEPTVSAPLDGRQLVKTATELYAEGSFPKKYNGMIVSTKDEGRPYVYTGGDILDVASWKKILLEGDATSIVIDDTLSDTSENPVQNKAIKAALDSIAASGIVVDAVMSSTSENPVQNKVIKAALDEKANVSDIPEHVEITAAEVAALFNGSGNTEPQEP